jgi:hypothetical protein
VIPWTVNKPPTWRRSSTAASTAHHRLPGPPARVMAGERPAAARGVRLAVRRRGPSRRPPLPAREHARVVPRSASRCGRHARARHGRDQGRRARRRAQPQDQPAHCSGGFAGTLIHDLTLAQIKTLDCGSQASSRASPAGSRHPARRCRRCRRSSTSVKASGNRPSG